MDDKLSKNNIQQYQFSRKERGTARNTLNTYVISICSAYCVHIYYNLQYRQICYKGAAMHTSHMFARVEEESHFSAKYI